MSSLPSGTHRPRSLRTHTPRLPHCIACTNGMTGCAIALDFGCIRNPREHKEQFQKAERRCAQSIPCTSHIRNVELSSGHMAFIR